MVPAARLVRRLTSPVHGARRSLRPDAHELPLGVVRSGGWSAAHLAPPALEVRDPAAIATILRRVDASKRLGRQPLWESYGEAGGTRSAGEVGTGECIGAFYAWLTAVRRPETVVEFGTAFGYSGMWFLAGLEAAGGGTLFTFEPNEVWRQSAQRNLAAVSGRFRSIAGTFEDHLDALDGRSIDLASIDAIHTSAFVEPQLELVAERLSSGGMVLLDDVDFSDDMRGCWDRAARRPDVVAATLVDDHVGVLEFGAPGR